MRYILTFLLVVCSAAVMGAAADAMNCVPPNDRACRPATADAHMLKVARRKPLTANIGVVSVGLDTYWKQCPGLYDDMLKKAAVFEKHIAAHQVKVASFGISDNPQKAASLIPAMKAADLDLLFVDMVTYATGRTISTSPRRSRSCARSRSTTASRVAARVWSSASRKGRSR